MPILICTRKCSGRAASLFLAFTMAAGAAEARAATRHEPQGKQAVTDQTAAKLRSGQTASSAESYILIDAETGKVLDEKNADALHYPATTKIMTSVCTWDAIQTGGLSLDSVITLSPHAAGMQNSELDRRLRAGMKMKVRDALALVAVASSNDMATALAEAVGGTEAHFAELMNEKAAALGMKNTHFVNASGLPDARQVTTVGDLALLGRAVLSQYQALMPYFVMKSVTYGGISYPNHNHLISGNKPYDGMDFGKTGFFRDARFNLVASARKGEERVLAVILSAPTPATRDNQMRGLLDEGFDVLTGPKSRTAIPHLNPPKEPLNKSLERSVAG